MLTCYASKKKTNQCSEIKEYGPTNLSPRNKKTNLLKMAEEIKIPIEKQLQTDFDKAHNVNAVQGGNNAASLVENEEMKQVSDNKTEQLKEKNVPALNGKPNRK
jgi:hypothetical protein